MKSSPHQGIARGWLVGNARADFIQYCIEEPDKIVSSKGFVQGLFQGELSESVESTNPQFLSQLCTWWSIAELKLFHRLFRRYPIIFCIRHHLSNAGQTRIFAGCLWWGRFELQIRGV